MRSGLYELSCGGVKGKSTFGGGGGGGRSHANVHTHTDTFARHTHTHTTSYVKTITCRCPRHTLTCVFRGRRCFTARLHAARAARHVIILYNIYLYHIHRKTII